MEREKKKKSPLNPFPSSSTVDGTVSITGGIVEDGLHHGPKFSSLATDLEEQREEEKGEEIEN
ncbi:hypothetical protein Bca4012_043044 [Brassica carinata]|uniref:Uncharacterized protein n=2 Tax=Brassica TaxID=3705 RepID=A0A8S9N8K8_BRACR|nr:hypothetical protein F2Q69_00041800 [Brassica cretica]CAF1732682.1 unnamed protein product [Brassica napus]